ncbi:hypothetical protein T484DRAFT_1776961 [Baffinella frigidus]|nr:hypothetical protein T484DRAFT_1776961 [Cryptophyta sp. CCMP2293]
MEAATRGMHSPPSALSHASQQPAAQKEPDVGSPSQETVEKANLSKLLIESHYQNLAKDKRDRMSRRRTLDRQLDQLQNGAPGAFVLAQRASASEKRAEGQVTKEERQDAIKEFGAKESAYQRIRRQKMAIVDFETVKVIGRGAFGEVIGRGAFGEVRLCRRANTGTAPSASDELFAIKILRKKATHGGVFNTGTAPSASDELFAIKILREKGETLPRVYNTGDAADASDELFAIKILRKKASPSHPTEMRAKDQIAHVRAERDLMRSASGDNE